MKLISDPEERESRQVLALECITDLLGVIYQRTSPERLSTAVVNRLRSSISFPLKGVRGSRSGPGGVSKRMGKPVRRRQPKNSQSSRSSRTRKHDVGAQAVRDDSLAPQEQKALAITLAVLRSNTDYADFLNSWLEDYGLPILSGKPPEPLLPELSDEDEPTVNPLLQ